ncbi:unnamed protein product [Ectocarpus sp. 8 AP-2014]
MFRCHFGGSAVGALEQPATPHGVPKQQHEDERGGAGSEEEEEEPTEVLKQTSLIVAERTDSETWDANEVKESGCCTRWFSRRRRRRRQQQQVS